MSNAPAISVRRATPASWIGLAIGLGLFGWLLYGTRGLDQALQNDITRVCVLITLASMWNLLAGYSGLVSIGQQVFVGLGGYGLIVISNGFEQDIYFSVLPAGLIALGAAAIIAVVAFRLPRRVLRRRDVGDRRGRAAAGQELQG